MKKIKFIIPFVLLGLIFTTGCEKFLDVNHSPNSPEESRLDLVFPAGVESTASITGNSFMSLGAIWAQHWTSDINMPGYMGEDSYNVQAGDYSYDLYGWSYLYYTPLMDFEWVKNKAVEEENWNYYLMATVMQCYTYQIMVDLWDEIPVSDALQKVPATFQPGPEVYDTLIQRIDFALAQDFEATTNTQPAKDDLVFAGDMSKWVEFANTLKLKIFIRQRFARSEVSKTGIQALYNSGVTFLSADAALTDFTDESGRGNYWYESNLRGSEGALRASNTFLLYLKDNVDPRLDFLFAPTGSGHEGIWQGDYRDRFDTYAGDEPVFSAPIMEALTPTYFISLTESKFLQAEAKMIIDASETEVEALYIEAIDANCNRYGIIADAANIYEGYAIFPSGDKTAQFEMLMMQKWVAMANGQGLEAFFEHNRTHIPKISAISPGDSNWDVDNYVPGEFTVSVEGNGILTPPRLFPKRLLFSSTERSQNPNVPATVELNVPVWWEVENPSVE